MKKRPSITLLTVLLTMVFAAGIGVYSSYIGMKIYQESSDHLLESFSQISETFTLFVQRNWTVLRQWDGLLKNADIDHAGSIGADMQANKESWHYSDFYLFNESTQYLTADGRRGSADSISGVFQEMYSEGGPIVSTYTASYGVPKIVFAMPLSRNMTLDGVTYTGLAVSYDTDVVDDLVDGSMYGGQSDCYIVRANGDIVLALEPQTDSGQLHRQFRAVVARYNRTCAPRARIIMTFGFSRLCDEDGKSRSISAWKAEADAHLKRNEAGLGGDAE